MLDVDKNINDVDWSIKHDKLELLPAKLDRSVVHIKSSIEDTDHEVFVAKVKKLIFKKFNLVLGKASTVCISLFWHPPQWIILHAGPANYLWGTLY